MITEPTLDHVLAVATRVAGDRARRANADTPLMLRLTARDRARVAVLLAQEAVWRAVRRFS